MGVTFVAFLLMGMGMLGFVARPRWVHWLGRALTLGIALAGTAVTLALYRLGHERHWTGDGPGMLVVMLGVGVFGVAATGAWISVWMQALVARREIPVGLDALQRRIAVLAIAVGLAGTGYAARESQVTQKPAHDAPVTALRFSKGGALLASLDRAGTLKTWDVATRALLLARTDPALADAHELWLARDGDVAMALGTEGARLLRLRDPDAPVLRLPGITHAAPLDDGDFALADGEGVRRVSLASPERARWRRGLPGVVTALAAEGDDRLLVALDDGRLIELERDGREGRLVATLAAAAVRLSPSPEGTWVVAIDATGHGHVIGPHGESVRPLPEWTRLDRVAFARDDVLVFAGPGDPAAFALRLASLHAEPWLNYGRALSALAAAAGAREAALALDGEILLAPAPGDGNAYTSESTRLVHRRP